MAYSQVPDSQTFATQNAKIRSADEREFTKPVTHDKPRIHTVASVAATGSASTDAAAIPVSASFVIVTAADGTKGVILPPVGAGLEINIYNPAASTLKVYPHSGGDVNDGTTDAAFSVTTKKGARFINVDGVTWTAIMA